MLGVPPKCITVSLAEWVVSGLLQTFYMLVMTATLGRRVILRQHVNVGGLFGAETTLNRFQSSV